MVVAVCAAFLAITAPAAALSVPADVLNTSGDQHIDYPAFSSETHAAPWMTVGNVGDVNGDGREDIAAGFAGAAPSDPGSVFVTFSSPLASVGEALGLGGFRIVTTSFWNGLSPAGDVNGDGRGDIAIVRNADVTIVFGRIDGATVDTAHLGDDGFTITGAGGSVGGGFNGVMINVGVQPLGDVNADGVPDLLVADHDQAAIVYPPRQAAGITIDAAAPGPRVARIAVDPAHAIDAASVDVLGDVDRDGRTDLMIAGEEVRGTDQVAYGVATPAPGATVTLPAAVSEGRAFSIRTHDGRDGWYGELEQARTLGDQNGDGIRDIGLLCGGCGTGNRQLRVVYSPAFGATVDAGDLLASDARGWSFHSYSSIVDVGDQDGDGDGDLATSSYVVLPDPAHESGTREPATSGFFFQDGDVVASLADVNGDGRREIAVADVRFRDTNGSGAQSATYAIDIYDSARAPLISLPEVPVLGPGGLLDVGLTIDPGAGSRGDGSLVLHPTLEIATPTGTPVTAADPGVLRQQRSLTLGIAPKSVLGGLTAGGAYRVRATAINGRGQRSEGPWRSFTYNPGAGQPLGGTPPGAKKPTAAKRKLGLSLGRSRITLRRGRLGVRVTCRKGTGRCRGVLRLTRGKLRVGAKSFSIASGRSATVRVPLRPAARRALRGKRSVRLVASAQAKGTGGATGTARATLSARLR